MRKWPIEILLFSLYFAFGISWLAYAPLLPEMEKLFQVSHARAAMLISLVSVSKAFVPLLAGLLASRLGLGRAVAVGALLASFAMLVPFAPNFNSMLALRFLFGTGGAVIVTLMGAVTMRLFQREELPMINGMNNVAVNCGITVSLFATVPLSRLIGWQSTLALFGALSGVLGLAWLLVGSGLKSDSAEKPQGEWLSVLKRRETWLIALAFTGPLSLYLSLNTWLPTYYQAAFGLDKAAASQTTGLFNLVGIPVALLGGWMTSRLGLRRPLIVTAGLLMPIAALGMVESEESWLRLLSAAFLGASFFLYVAPLFTIPMELPGMRPESVALLCGVVFSSAYAVSFVAPTLVGWLQEMTGSFLPGLRLVAFGSASLALGGALLPETGRRLAALRLAEG